MCSSDLSKCVGWILLELSDEVECLVQDLQAEQEQGT